MGRLLDKNTCSGCTACGNVCPVKCISMEQDESGFYMPAIDCSKCLDCGLCEKACKSANEAGNNSPLFGKAFTIDDSETLSQSSSGGAFTAIASIVLSRGGVVYGAAFDETFCVRHIRVEDVEELKRLNGSKYVQSDLGNCFEQVKNDLKTGRMVLFSGTPCQVAGLVACLQRKHRENLLAVDFVCHGVPAPKAWRAYLKHLQETVVGPTRSVNMRDHRLSQENYGMCVVGEKEEYFKSCAQDPYLVAFANDLILRESCYRCKHKKIKCHSDITLADLWGAKNLLPDQSYTGHHSLVIANSSAGAAYIEELSSFGTVGDVSLEQALIINASRFYPTVKNATKGIKEVIDELGEGQFEQNFSVIKQHESFFAKVKRKITVLGKCFVLKSRRG